MEEEDGRGRTEAEERSEDRREEGRKEGRKDADGRTRSTSSSAFSFD